VAVKVLALEIDEIFCVFLLST